MSSLCYRLCQGVGIRTSKLYRFLSVPKCIKVLREVLPNRDFKEDVFNIDDYIGGYPFDGLGNMLCYCDDTYTLSYEGFGDEMYFYYPPSYPWEQNSNRPENICEVHRRITDAVLRLCDIEREQVNALINDHIYSVVWED